MTSIIYIMKYLFSLAVILFITEAVSAQTDSGNVVVYKDPRLPLLVRKQAQINEETTRNSRRSMPGYRIQIVNTTDRNLAIDAKTKVYQLYPELKAYLLFQSPYYRIKVGNFRARSEAESYIKSLQRDFPGSIFIIKDIIEVKPENEFTE
jgi:hypothetical protein